MTTTDKLMTTTDKGDKGHDKGHDKGDDKGHDKGHDKGDKVMNRENARFKILNHKWSWGKDQITQRLIPHLFQHLEALEAEALEAEALEAEALEAQTGKLTNNQGNAQGAAQGNAQGEGTKVEGGKDRSKTCIKIDMQQDRHATR